MEHLWVPPSQLPQAMAAPSHLPWKQRSSLSLAPMGVLWLPLALAEEVGGPLRAISRTGPLVYYK